MTGPFAAWAAWRARRALLGQFRRETADAQERDRFVVKDYLTYALSSIERGDQTQALEWWTKSIGHYPSETRSSPLAIKVLLKIRRFDEAEDLMLAGRKSYPGDPHFAIGLADIARERGDHDAAIERYAVLRKRFPGVLSGYVFGAESLIVRNRVSEAEEIVKVAMTRFPEELGGFLGYARVAVHQKNWVEALSRWQQIKEKFDHEIGYTGTAQAMIRLGRLDEADAFLAAARLRFPISADIQTELARTAQARGDLPEAIARWERLMERFPLHMHGYLQAAEAMETIGERGKATAILIDAVDRFPAESRPLEDFANLMRRRADPDAAGEAWSALRQTCPNNRDAYMRGAEALAEAGRLVEADTLREEYRLRFDTDCAIR